LQRERYPRRTASRSDGAWYERRRMASLVQYFALSAPLYAIVLVGYLLALWPGWRPSWTEWASKFVFALALPALLFRMMSDLSALPPVDTRLLFAFFGGCLIVFGIGRAVAVHVFQLDGVGQSVFALGGVFSNNVMLGLPLAKLTLGPAAVPSVALVLLFNSLSLWMLVSISIEWARSGSFTLAGLAKTAFGVFTNPIIAAILSGMALGLSGYRLPRSVDFALLNLGRVAAPAALFVLGLGLTRYGVRQGWQYSLAICALKLLLMPLVVFGLARALGLPLLETKVIVLLAAMAMGANVYLVAVQFQTLQGPIASALVVSTLLAAFTTPLLLAALDALSP
jgi:malonate transporter